ncbi:MAG TPA: cupin domain-containing protein [Solirubrobacterales bacterium]|nr:cupin domain-containing protein [Solirubrobacterales bacterium]
MSECRVVKREEVADWMAEYPGFGEMRSFTDALGAEEVAFTWRLMPSGTGGKGSYGHRHKDQEEIYFVVRGNVQFKLDDEVVDAGPQTAVRVPTHVFRSVHNDGPDEAELIICSKCATGDEAEAEQTDADFWPD